jgi:DNA-binding transcriptional ArsR family regulator
MELIQHQAELCGVMADEHRLLMLYALAQKAHNVSQLAALLGLSQPSTSRHLKILRQGRVVTVRRQGKLVYYSLSDPRIIQALDLLRLVLLDQMKHEGDLASPQVIQTAIPPMPPQGASGDEEAF